MPVYPYRCLECQHKDDLVLTYEESQKPRTCPKCGKQFVKDWSRFTSGIEIFKPQWFEHIDINPIFIESRRQLHEECKKRGLTSVYLESGYRRC